MPTNVDVSSVIKTCVGQDTRFPLSPLSIPETPESENKHHCPRQPFSESPRSPVSRSPRSRSLTCRTKLLSSRSLQPQKMSPKSGDTLEAENAIGHFGSVKRLMRGSETHQKAKCPRIGPLQKKSSEQELSSEGDDLSKFLQIIRETDLKYEKSIKAVSKNIEKKSGKVEKTIALSALPDKILGDMTSGKGSGSIGPIGSITKLPRATHHKISSSEDEKENIPLRTKPSMDLTEPSSDNQSDLMVSYTSWACNNDGGEKEENVFICVNEKKLKEVNLGDKENAVTTAEENFSLLDDSWFNDQMEQCFEEPEHKKTKLEYVFVYLFFGFYL